MKLDPPIVVPPPPIRERRSISPVNSDNEENRAGNIKRRASVGNLVKSKSMSSLDDPSQTGHAQDDILLVKQKSLRFATTLEQQDDPVTKHKRKQRARSMSHIKTETKSILKNTHERPIIDTKHPSLRSIVDSSDDECPVPRSPRRGSTTGLRQAAGEQKETDEERIHRLELELSEAREKLRCKAATNEPEAPCSPQRSTQTKQTRKMFGRRLRNRMFSEFKKKQEGKSRFNIFQKFLARFRMAGPHDQRGPVLGEKGQPMRKTKSLSALKVEQAIPSPSRAKSAAGKINERIQIRKAQSFKAISTPLGSMDGLTQNGPALNKEHIIENSVKESDAALKKENVIENPVKQNDAPFNKEQIVEQKVKLENLQKSRVTAKSSKLAVGNIPPTDTECSSKAFDASGHSKTSIKSSNKNKQSKKLPKTKRRKSTGQYLPKQLESFESGGSTGQSKRRKSTGYRDDKKNHDDNHENRHNFNDFPTSNLTKALGSSRRSRRSSQKGASGRDDDDDDWKSAHSKISTLSRRSLDWHFWVESSQNNNGNGRDSQESDNSSTYESCHDFDSSFSLSEDQPHVWCQSKDQDAFVELNIRHMDSTGERSLTWR